MDGPVFLSLISIYPESGVYKNYERLQDTRGLHSRISHRAEAGIYAFSKRDGRGFGGQPH